MFSEYKNATKDDLGLYLAGVVDSLDTLLERLVNYGLSESTINALEKKGERIIAIAERLKELE